MDYFSTIVILTTGCLVFLCSGFHGLEITISPEKSIATTLEAVEMSCVQDALGANMKEITAMTIYRNDEGPLAVLSPCLNISYGTHTPGRLQAEGTINNKGGDTSHLNLTLSDPASEDTGIYTCVLYYLDRQGIMREQKASKNMLVDNLDIQSLENVLNSMKNKINLLEKQLADANKSAAFTVAFSASNRMKSIKAKNGNTLILPDVIMRYGEGYDETTGIFTATREGIYAFHVEVTNSSPGEHMFLDLRANDNVIAKLRIQDNSHWDHSSMSSTVHLKPGDNVFSVMRSDGDVFQLDLHSMFTGYLIHAI